MQFRYLPMRKLTLLVRVCVGVVTTTGLAVAPLPDMVSRRLLPEAELKPVAQKRPRQHPLRENPSP